MSAKPTVKDTLGWFNTGAGFSAYDEVVPNAMRVVRVNDNWSATGNGTLLISQLTFANLPLGANIVAFANSCRGLFGEVEQFTDIVFSDPTDFATPSDIAGAEAFATSEATAAQAAAEGYADSTKLAKSANLSDLSSVSSAISALGLGTAALQPSSAFESAITPGTTAQYWRGDKTWQALPAPGTGTVTSVGLTSTNLTVTGSPVTTSGSMTVNLPNVGTAGSYTNITTDAQGRVTSGTSYSQSTASRTLNSGFQVSTTRNSLVNYSVDITTAATLVGGQTGTVFLEIASDSGFTTNLQELARFVNGNSVSLAIAITVNQTITGTLTGFVPANYYCRLRTANTVGSPSFTYRAGQEVLL